MPGLEGIGRALILVAAILLVVGVLLVLAPRIPFLGRLPGDLSFERDGVRVYVPLATMALISLVASVLLSILTRR